MDAELRARAEARLTEAAARARLADPRPSYRDRLKQLRETHGAAFERAVAHYEQNVLPALARDAAPLAVWAEYGRFLGGLTAEGRLVRIDASGRAATWQERDEAGDLILFIPDENAEAVLVVAEPIEPSAAQSATRDLLVSRKLALG